MIEPRQGVGVPIASRRKSRLRAKIVSGTLRYLCYLSPLWLFGPLFYLTVLPSGPSREDGAPGGDVSSLPAGPPGRVEVDTVGRNETLSDIFLANGIDYAQLLEVLRASRGLFDLNRLRSGSVVRIFFDRDDRFSRLEYEIDDRRLLHVDVPKPDSMSAAIEVAEYAFRSRVVEGEISSSLYETVSEMEEDPRIAYLLSEIFAWQIDFSTDIRKGDYFRAIVEEYRGRDGIEKLSAIRAAEFFNRGRLYQAFRYEDPEGHVDYYDGTGASLRRKFLRSPLKYTRISSGFTRRRFHPILKIYRPHLGIDYAAPPGTPVVTVGDGEVIYAGWDRGFGRIVKVRHNAVYVTTYGHLSRFARGIRKGKRVRQGQVIGYVGSSGLATGPHLDYRLLRRGRYVNPLTVDLPAADPVKKKYRSAFRDVVLENLGLLDEESLLTMAYRADADSL